MATTQLRTRFWPGVLAIGALLGLSCLAVCHAVPAPSSDKKGQKNDARGAAGNPESPVMKIPVEAIGYLPESPTLLASRIPASSLDFIDGDHLLFTFHTAGLMKRLPEEPHDDEDQNIRAVVLELPSGKLLRSADWRMHDHGRYLWPLQNGTFLVRERDALFSTDSSLELKPYLSSQARLQSLQASADGKLLVVEFDEERHSVEEHKRLTEQALVSGSRPPNEDVKVIIVKTVSGEVVATSHAQHSLNVPVFADGYMEALPANFHHWQLSYRPFKAEKQVFGDVQSTCPPMEVGVTSAVALLFTCVPESDDSLVQGIDRNGKILWDFWWRKDLVWPSYASSPDGSRFAIGVVRLSHAVDVFDPVNDDDIKGQRVQVFDPVGGSVLLTVNVAPAVAAGGSFALSPDGKKFAVLEGGRIDIYAVPEPAPTTGPTAKRK